MQCVFFAIIKFLAHLESFLASEAHIFNIQWKWFFFLHHKKPSFSSYLWNEYLKSRFILQPFLVIWLSFPKRLKDRRGLRDGNVALEKWELSFYNEDIAKTTVHIEIRLLGKEKPWKDNLLYINI